MTTLTVSTSKPYDIKIGRGSLEQTGSYMASIFDPCKVAVLTDSIVDGYYADSLLAQLRANGFSADKILFPGGEHSKNAGTYVNILEALAADGLSRSDVILALGGGVVSDLAGFVAGTYLRGLPYVVVPTTFQGAIDAAIGGKTGINLNSGKNLAGVIWQPSLVVCDPDTFQTLPAATMLDGIAEAVKYAVISEASLIDKILAGDYAYVLERCVSIKKSLVEVDERDRGLRHILNFGHTIGHGIEKLTSYRISHGRAVAKGMIAESLGAYRTGLAPRDISGDLSDLLEALGFDVSLTYDASRLCQLALNDKKIAEGKITMIIPESIGKCHLKKLALDELFELITAGVF